MLDHTWSEDEITAWVDIEAPPPDGQPTAYLIFGTNQMTPAEIVRDRYRAGLAPFIVLTGGVNRHNGVIEAQRFREFLLAGGVSEKAIRWEDRSANTWENVENASPHLQEALASGLSITAVSKWYHRRAVRFLKTLLPAACPFYAATWEPVYGGEPVTRSSWPRIPGGRRRVMREWEETSRRIADGSLADAAIRDGAWS